MKRDIEKVVGFEVLVDGPFDFKLTVNKPAGWDWSTPGEVFDRDSLWSGMHAAGTGVGLKLRSRGQRVRVEAFARNTTAEGGLAEAVRRGVKRGLGADQDIDGFYRFAKKDPLLKKVVSDRNGMRFGNPGDLFGRVILAISLQMASTGRSRQMMGSVLDLYGTKLSFDSHQVALWPTPRAVAKAGEAALRHEANLGYRGRLLHKAASYLVANPMTMDELDPLTDEEAIRRIKQIPGIGDYSAGIVLGRSAPIDAWSVILMSELLLGRTPERPRDEIPEVLKVVEERWGKWSWLAFAYILNDLENLSKEYHITRMT